MMANLRAMSKGLIPQLPSQITIPTRAILFLKPGFEKDPDLIGHKDIRKSELPPRKHI
jgi:hypothetical protein